ncbi:uncharacterized protein [Apostichopus japonicus]|uniref:uncharacterized protein n=1 Tax=Stichopus japonicus TaxID=307972 RepID=UPI003AB6F732
MDVRLIYVFLLGFVVTQCSPISEEDGGIQVRAKRDELIIQRLFDALPAIFKQRQESSVKQEPELSLGLRGLDTLVRESKVENLKEDGFIGDKGCHHVFGDDGCHKIMEDGTEVFISG